MQDDFGNRNDVAIELLRLIDDDIDLLSDAEVISELEILKVDAVVATENIRGRIRKIDRSTASAEKLLELVDGEDLVESMDGMTLEEVNNELSALGVSPGRLIHGAEQRCRDEVVQHIGNAENENETKKVPNGRPARVRADQIRGSSNDELKSAGTSRTRPYRRGGQMSGGLGWIGAAVAALVAFLVIIPGSMRVVAMLVMHQLTSHGVDGAFVDMAWIVAGSMGAAFMISIAWRTLRLMLYLVSWLIIALFGLVVFGHLALELF